MPEKIIINEKLRKIARKGEKIGKTLANTYKRAANKVFAELEKQGRMNREDAKEIGDFLKGYAEEQRRHYQNYLKKNSQSISNIYTATTRRYIRALEKRLEYLEKRLSKSKV